MTEEMARTKRCPLAGGYPNVKEAEVPEHYRGSRCIASDCALWVSTDNEGEPRSAIDKTPVIYKPAGHCGLCK